MVSIVFLEFIQAKITLQNQNEMNRYIVLRNNTSDKIQLIEVWFNRPS